MARFRKAVESANGCKFRVDCPVLSKLRDLPKGDRHADVGRNPGIRGQPHARGEGAEDGDSADVGGGAEDTDEEEANEDECCSDCPYFCPVCGECMYEDECDE